MNVTTSRLGIGLLASLLCAAQSDAGIVPVIPRLPQELLPPKTAPEPAPAPKDPATKDPADKEDPKPEANDLEKIAERISQNSKLASDKLKDQDPGEETRKTQEQILKDIDELLKQSQNSPPMGGGGGGGGSSSDMNDQNSGMPPPMGGSSSSSGGGSNSGGQSSPQGGQPPMGQGQRSQQPSKRPSWRDREQQQQNSSGTGKKDQAPMPMTQGSQRPEPKQELGGRGEQQQPANAMKGGQDPKGGAAPGEGGQSKPSLPLDDAITKQVWGHLPEKLRQQMSQYYKEQFMPKYGELLRQYYSNLAEREKAPKK